MKACTRLPLGRTASPAELSSSQIGTQKASETSPPVDMLTCLAPKLNTKTVTLRLGALLGEYGPITVVGSNLLRSMPTSSATSLITVARRSRSSGRLLPPGRATCPDHGSLRLSLLLMRRMLGLPSRSLSIIATAASELNPDLAPSVNSSQG